MFMGFKMFRLREHNNQRKKYYEYMVYVYKVSIRALCMKQEICNIGVEWKKRNLADECSFNAGTLHIRCAKLRYFSKFSICTHVFKLCISKFTVL